VTYAPVFPPFPHQVEARDRMRGRREFALLMGMRTGKTKTLLDDWGEMVEAGEVRDLLLVAPAGALYGEDALETQVPQHVPRSIMERARFAVWRSGGGVTQRRAVESLLRERDPKRPRILLTNIEALSTVVRAREMCSAFLEPQDRGSVLAIDESTTIKSKSQRTDAVLELGEFARYRRILSGLVTPHSPLDLYYQFQFLNPKILNHHSWYGFRAKYAVLKKVCFLPAAAQEALRAKGRHPPQATVVVAYRNEEELRERIAPHSYRVQLRDCREAPPARYLFRDVELTPEQARIYKELKADATSQLSAGPHVTATAAMTQFLRLHQLVCGYVVDEEGQQHDVPERRTQALLDILADYDGKAIVWCSYDRNVRKLLKILQSPSHLGLGSVAAFWGGNRSTREEEERRFKGDRGCRVMVATAAAGGRGREWSCADLVVYYSNSPNLEHRDQSEMRVESFKKVDPVTRIDLRVPGTVDDVVIKNLRAKINMASVLQGDGWREWLI
jgi:hypothetical protein